MKSAIMRLVVCGKKTLPRWKYDWSWLRASNELLEQRAADAQQHGIGALRMGRKDMLVEASWSRSLRGMGL